MQSTKQIIQRFFTGISAAFTLAPLPYEPFPFAFPEKALTFDWDNIGTDLNLAIATYEGKNERI
jgi:hypothetical protein